MSTEQPPLQSLLLTRRFKLTRKLIAAIRRNVTVQTFKFRRYWLGPESANVMFLTASRDMAIPLLKASGVRMGNSCDINTPVIFHNFIRKAEQGSRIAYDQLEMGECCHIGRDCFFDLRERIVLGDRVIISMRSTFISHLDVGSSSLKNLYPSTSSPISIGHDTYIGAGAIILHGVSLGRSCLVAAGSVVTKSFGDCSLIAGIPAKLVKTIPASTVKT